MDIVKRPGALNGDARAHSFRAPLPRAQRERRRILPSSSRPSIEGLPQIFWADYAPWREANLWAVERATTGDASLKTVASNMNGLLNYAKFLESRDLQWFEFPARKADRCPVLYRGALIKMRDAGQIGPSTASEYMRNCIMFYRWVRHRSFFLHTSSCGGKNPTSLNTSTGWGSSERSAEPPPTSASRTVSARPNA